MTYEQAKELIPDISFVRYAGSYYRYAGPSAGMPNSHLCIYDEPPSEHVDLVKIENCELLVQPINKDIEGVEEAAKEYADTKSYQSDKEQITTTPWSQWNISEEGFKAGAEWQAKQTEATNK